MSIQLTVILAIIGFQLVTNSLVGCNAQNARQNPKLETVTLLSIADSYKNLPKNETCNGIDDIAQRAEQCAQPLLDLVQGTLVRWPKTDKDAEDLCQAFLWAEKCTRDIGRKCAKGIQKTIISTLANSIQRTRKRECSKSSYAQVIRTTTCVEKNKDIARRVVANATSKAIVIEKQIDDLDKKTVAVCCLVQDVEANIRHYFGPKCPNESAHVIKLIRSILEDVIEIICRNPKCKDVFIGYRLPKLKSPVGLVSTLLRTVFILGY